MSNVSLIGKELAGSVVAAIYARPAGRQEPPLQGSASSVPGHKAKWKRILLVLCSSAPEPIRAWHFSTSFWS